MTWYIVVLKAFPMYDGFVGTELHYKWWRSCKYPANEWRKEGRNVEKTDLTMARGHGNSRRSSDVSHYSSSGDPDWGGVWQESRKWARGKNAERGSTLSCCSPGSGWRRGGVLHTLQPAESLIRCVGLKICQKNEGWIGRNWGVWDEWRGRWDFERSNGRQSQ